MWTDALLEFRPTNVVHRLGMESRIPLLNARDVFYGLDGSRAALWMPKVHSQDEIAGVLRAASHSKSPLGLCLWIEDDLVKFQHENPVGSLVWTTCEQARSLVPCPPLCFHVQIPALNASVNSELDTVCSLIVACVQAGYTSFGMDLRSAKAEDDFSWLTKVMTPALDLELAFAVRLDFSDRGNASGILESLRSAGALPDIVLLSAQSESDVESMAVVKLAKQNPGLKLAWAGKLDLVPQELFTAIIGESILEDECVDGQEPANHSLRLEAKAYTRALVRMKRMGLKGTIDRVVSRLVSR